MLYFICYISTQKDTLMSCLETCTVQAFNVDSSYDIVKTLCDKTHTPLSVFLSHQFEDLLQKGEKKWGVSISEFETALSLEDKQQTCRFRIRISVKKKIDCATSKNMRLQGYQLAFMLYVVAKQIQSGSKKRRSTK